MENAWRKLGAQLALGDAAVVIYRFGSFELDLATAELRAGGESRPLEPQVFAVLALLIENRERLVSKEELIEKVWDGRVVSDAALASRVKSARKALGDDGKSQQFIKTVHGKGFRFVAAVSASGRSETRDLDPPGSSDASHRTGGDSQLVWSESRPSLAVLSFRFVGDDEHANLAMALPDELITELSRLRWLLIVARGSSFRLRATDADVGEIGHLLRVRYCMFGTVEASKGRLAVTVELVDTRDASIVWGDRFAGAIDDVHSIREQIRSQVVVALELRIPLHEAMAARVRVPENLDAWSAYHLGLQHLYRFNRHDNVRAAALFARAAGLDPSFARAQAGLSFCQFQNAFLRYTDDVAGAARETRRFAERGLELDPLDPFVNFTMGRSYWLEGDLQSSASWLERATVISPCYAQGIYARGWTEALDGRALEGRAHVDFAMRLSPLDPLHYAMQATRALTHIAQGEDAEAARWAERATRAPGAHVLIAMIAAVTRALAGDDERAAAWASNARERNSALTAADFLRAFPMQVAEMRERVSRVLQRLGF